MEVIKKFGYRMPEGYFLETYQGSVLCINGGMFKVHGFGLEDSLGWSLGELQIVREGFLLKMVVTRDGEETEVPLTVAEWSDALDTWIIDANWELGK